MPGAYIIALPLLLQDGYRGRIVYLPSAAQGAADEAWTSLQESLKARLPEFFLLCVSQDPACLPGVSRPSSTVPDSTHTASAAAAR